MLKLFFSYYKPHRRLFFWDMVCAFVVAICDLFYPMIARNIINIYVPDQNLRLLLVWSGIMLVIYLVKAMLNYFIQYWGHVVGVRIQGDMRAEMFAKLQKLPFSYFDSNKTGVIMSRMVNGLMDVSELAHHGPEDLFISVIMLLGSFIMLSSINLYLALIVFTVLPFIIIFAIRTRKQMSAAFTRAREEIAEVNAEVESTVSGVRISRAYTAANHEKGKFEVVNERYKQAQSGSYKVMGKFSSVMGLFTDFLYLLVLVAGGLFYFYGLIDMGGFAAYLLYITMFLKPINRLVSLFEQIQNGMTGFERFRQVIDAPSQQDFPNAVDAGVLTGKITIEDVTFAYPTEDEGQEGSNVIDHLNLTIEAGSTVALVGSSGCGKTTLCHLIPRFYEIDGGKIMVDGRDIREYTLDSLRRNIGMVAQDVFLFNGTIRENIAYGRPDATHDEIEAAARAASIHDHIISLPEGYDTKVGERGVKLSGGQKQRVSMARVFLKDPPILILDEATSALDNMTERAITESLSELAKGRTCVVVAHRLSTVKHASEIVVLGPDGIQERGTHEELLESKGIYEELYQHQFRT